MDSRKTRLRGGKAAGAPRAAQSIMNSMKSPAPWRTGGAGAATGAEAILLWRTGKACCLYKHSKQPWGHVLSESIACRHVTAAAGHVTTSCHLGM